MRGAARHPPLPGSLTLPAPDRRLGRYTSLSVHHMRLTVRQRPSQSGHETQRRIATLLVLGLALRYLRQCVRIPLRQGLLLGCSHRSRCHRELQEHLPARLQLRHRRGRARVSPIPTTLAADLHYALVQASLQALILAGNPAHEASHGRRQTSVPPRLLTPAQPAPIRPLPRPVPGSPSAPGCSAPGAPLLPSPAPSRGAPGRRVASRSPPAGPAPVGSPRRETNGPPPCATRHPQYPPAAQNRLLPTGRPWRKMPATLGRFPWKRSWPADGWPPWPPRSVVGKAPRARS